MVNEKIADDEKSSAKCQYADLIKDMLKTLENGWIDVKL